MIIWSYVFDLKPCKQLVNTDNDQCGTRLETALLVQDGFPKLVPNLTDRVYVREGLTDLTDLTDHIDQAENIID